MSVDGEMTKLELSLEWEKNHLSERKQGSVKYEEGGYFRTSVSAGKEYQSSVDFTGPRT